MGVEADLADYEPFEFRPLVSADPPPGAAEAPCRHKVDPESRPRQTSAPPRGPHVPWASRLQPTGREMAVRAREDR